MKRCRSWSPSSRKKNALLHSDSTEPDRGMPLRASLAASVVRLRLVRKTNCPIESATRSFPPSIPPHTPSTERAPRRNRRALRVVVVRMGLPGRLPPLGVKLPTAALPPRVRPPVGSGIGRLMRHVVGQSAAAWVTLVADDHHLETSGAACRTGLITFFVICSLLGAPLSWRKTSGGDTLTWVSNCSTSPIDWENLSAGPNGFADGVRERRKRKRSTCLLLRNGEAEQTMLRANSNMKRAFFEPALQNPCIAPGEEVYVGYHVTFVSS